MQGIVCAANRAFVFVWMVNLLAGLDYFDSSFCVPCFFTCHSLASPLVVHWRETGEAAWPHWPGVGCDSLQAGPSL